MLWVQIPVMGSEYFLSIIDLKKKEDGSLTSNLLGPVVQKPITANPGLNVCPMVLFPTLQR